jgi:hypothetical protein
MNPVNKDESQTFYGRWSQTVTDLLAWQMNLFQAEYQVGLEMVQAALRLPGGSAAMPQPVDEFHRLEALALERVGKGLAPPREIYRAPYRDRIDWGKLPDWARPIDPEVFQDSGHEG